ncbi:hypothetical protein [Bacteroides intestinalis]|nr:hypothetical protein [Bacteroides intestinalis]
MEGIIIDYTDYKNQPNYLVSANGNVVVFDKVETIDKVVDF